MKACGTLGTVAVLLVLLLITPWPLFYNGKESAKGTVCLSNLKQQATGLLLYVGDSNGGFPLRDDWMEGVEHYAKEGILRDPALYKDGTPQGYGYAFNAALSRAKAPRSPEGTLLVYDSANPVRNASDPVTSLPSPGRHAGRNNVGYADGHARSLAAGKAP